MDWLRSCYSSRWRLTDGSATETAGYYCFAPPGALLIDRPTPVGSANWTDDDFAEDLLLAGEVRGGPRPWRKGDCRRPVPPGADGGGVQVGGGVAGGGDPVGGGVLLGAPPAAGYAEVGGGVRIGGGQLGPNDQVGGGELLGAPPAAVYAQVGGGERVAAVLISTPAEVGGGELIGGGGTAATVGGGELLSGSLPGSGPTIEVPCGSCGVGTAPDVWLFTGSGFTGTKAFANGQHLIPYAGPAEPCYWRKEFPGGKYLLMFIGSVMDLSVLSIDGAGYRVSGAYDCHGTNVLDLILPHPEAPPTVQVEPV